MRWPAHAPSFRNSRGSSRSSPIPASTTATIVSRWNGTSSPIRGKSALPCSKRTRSTCSRRSLVDATAQAGLSLKDIDALVTNTITGLAIPSLDALLMNRLDFSPNVERLPIFGIGCGGGVAGMARAARMAQGKPGHQRALHDGRPVQPVRPPQRSEHGHVRLRRAVWRRSRRRRSAQLFGRCDGARQPKILAIRRAPLAQHASHHGLGYQG